MHLKHGKEKLHKLEVESKKQVMAQKMPKTVDSATSKQGHAKMEKRNLINRNTHGTGLTKGYAF